MNSHESANAALRRELSEIKDQLAQANERCAHAEIGRAHAARAFFALIQRSTDLNELLDVFAEQLFALSNVDGCLVNLVTGPGDALETAYIKLPDEFAALQNTYKGFLYRLDQPDANVLAFRSGTPAIVYEDELDSYAESTRMRFERWKMRNMGVVPLIVKFSDGSQRPIGTVMVFSKKQRLDATLVDRVLAIGELYAAQIQVQWNCRQLMEKGKTVDLMHAEIRQFVAYITEMNSLTAVEEVYSLIGQRLIDRFRFDFVSILLAENDELAIVHSTFSAPYQPIARRYEPFRRRTRYKLQMRSGAHATVFLNNQRFLFEDCMKLLHLPMSENDRTTLELLETPRTILHVPIRVQDTPVGVLSLGTLAAPINLPEADISLIELLASFIGTAIRNAQAHSLVEQQNCKIALLNQDLEHKMLLLDKVARIDRLTGLNNFGNFEEELKRRANEYTRAESGIFLSVILLDIDHFKDFNDSHGHPAGNQVLQETAVRLLECVREMDFVARYGGEEFVVLLPQCGLVGAAAIAERIRHRISEQPFQVNGRPRAISISGGCAQFRPGESAHEFICRVDTALYEAKKGGRNRIQTASLTPEKNAA